MTLLLSRGAGPMPETRLKMAAVAANVQRAEKVGRAQADLARRAVQTLREADERGRQEARKAGARLIHRKGRPGALFAQSAALSRFRRVGVGRGQPPAFFR